jgi:HrpA-like RNA helicase
VVHHEAKKFGFVTKSYGKNEDRAVRVTKGRAAPAQESLFELPLGPASRDSLGAYFARHPPTEAEVQAAAGEARLGDAYGSGAAGSSDEEGGDAAPDGGGAGGAGGAGGRRRRTDRGPHAAEFSPAEVARRQARWTARQARPELAPLRAGRAALPIAQHRGEILAAMAAHQVILIAGETGCGKTTPVPQYIMEDAWSRGAGCRVICTQPRRISAISVADRVAAERGEAVGEDVGYTIRLESKGGPESSLVFCTNGVLLRMLTAPGGGGGGVARVTHLVIDEIHERDRFADFLLILVRDLLPSRPDLRVVLMSATLHVDLFSAYFGGCPVVRVPGFTHPVQDFYLEDVLRLTGYEERAVAEVERGLGGRAAAAGVVRANGGGGGGAAAAAARVPAQERAAVAAAVEAAFKVGGDAEFEALMEVTGAAGADDAGGGAPAVNVRHPASGVTALMAAAFHGREDVVHVLLGNGADPGAAANSYVDPASGARHAGLTAAQWAARRGHAGVAQLLQAHQEASADADAVSNAALSLSHYQKNQDQDEVDVGLIETLLQYICGEGPFRGAPGGARPQQAAAGEAQGAVLVFLPGWDEIIRLKEALEGSAAFGNAARYLVLPLHSQVAPAEQRRVFARTPRGARKLVLATNIAETAITIDDVVCVIDAGRLKEKSYDAYTGVSTLQTAWISKASERQRRGRAGRCQPGVAFRMYSRQRSDGLDEFQAPEIQRSPLDEMCLQVKLLEDRAAGRRVSIARFLGKAVEPPVAAAVDGALRLLEDIGALDAGERLTSLGRHLAALPLAPALGKMLLYGLLYRCLDPVLTVACFMAYRCA